MNKKMRKLLQPKAANEVYLAHLMLKLVFLKFGKYIDFRVLCQFSFYVALQGSFPIVSSTQQPSSEVIIIL